MTIQQVSIAFAKYITGYRPGDDGWGPEDDQAYNFALCDEVFFESKDANDLQGNVVSVKE
jgi:hypothetical protein